MSPFILIVGDDARIRSILSDAFTCRGYRVDMAPDGQQALDRVAFDMPDVIVAPSAMEGVDGPSLVRRLRDDGQRVPVVLTGAAPGGGRLPGVQLVPDPCDVDRITGAVNLGLASQLA